MSKVDDYQVHRLTEDIYADIEKVGSIGWVEMPDGLRAVMVTDHAAIKQIGVSPDVSRDGAQHWAALRAGEIPMDSITLPWATEAGPFSAYGDEHKRLRKLMMPGFTKRRIDTLAPSIEETVTGILNGLEFDRAAHVPRRRPLGGWGRPWSDKPVYQVDLRQRFCFPVPIAAISAMLGVDDDLFPAIRAGADALFDTSLSREELTPLFMGLLGAIDELIERKRATPDESLTSSLIQANQDGDTYTPEELAQVVRIMIVGGYETTVNLLDQAVYLLLTHREYLAMTLAGHITWDDVLDEVLRHSSPAAAVPMRFAVKDITIAGFPIPAGTPILVSFAGAGRDPNVYAKPDVFDPTRATTMHLGFGTGRHRCPGAPLAMLEARIALPMLFDRFRLELVEDPYKIDPSPGIITNGHKRLLVRLHPKN